METLHDQRDAAPESVVAEASSTGLIPSRGRIDEVLAYTYDRYKDHADGVVADYIPALAAADPATFGMSVMETNGTEHRIGASIHEFSIQSISKAFVFALVDNALGHDTVRGQIGVNNTGLAFNSVMAIELTGAPPQPHGQCRCHRDYRAGAQSDRRRAMGIYPSGPRGLCRP